MPFSLYVFLYKRFQEKFQKEFQKKNKLLNSKDIEHLAAADPARASRVFHSAVVDHAPVDDFPYYLTPPVPPLFYHDNFKRALIAEALGGYAGLSSIDVMDEALAALDALRDSENPGYVQIFAWHSLGCWLSRDREVFSSRKTDLFKALGGTAGSLTGALHFLDALRAAGENESVVTLLTQAAAQPRYKVQTALFGFYLIRHGYDQRQYIEAQAQDKNMTDFFRRCGRGKFFSSVNFETGIREIGLVRQSQKGGLQTGTQQDDIARRLMNISAEYVSAAGFYLKNYWQ